MNPHRRNLAALHARAEQLRDDFDVLDDELVCILEPSHFAILDAAKTLVSDLEVELGAVVLELELMRGIAR